MEKWLILGKVKEKHRMNGASIGSETKQILKKQKGTCFDSIYTKIGIIQRRFSWPLVQG